MDDANTTVGGDGPLLGLMREMMRRWADGDIDGVVEMFDDDIVWHFAAGPFAPVRGKDAARALLEQFQRDMHDVRWRVFGAAETSDRLFVEGVDAYTTPEGHEVATPYAGVMEFRDRKVTGWRDYVDIGTTMRQRAGAEFSEHVRELLDRPSV